MSLPNQSKLNTLLQSMLKSASTKPNLSQVFSAMSKRTGSMQSNLQGTLQGLSQDAHAKHQAQLQTVLNQARSKTMPTQDGMVAAVAKHAIGIKPSSNQAEVLSKLK